MTQNLFIVSYPPCHVVFGFGMININIALLVLALAPPLTNFKELDSDHLGLGEDKVWSV